MDEAGRGPLAGPVVASAVIVRDVSFSCAIDDSKRMTPETREIAYREIRQKCRVGVSVVGHEVIDEVNIFQAAMRAMREALEGLGERPACVLVDGNRAPKGLPVEPVPVVGGDGKSLAIACASIVAKVTRDRIMEEYDAAFPGYGFARHKGYCTREHVRALLEKGPCGIHRRSFEPVKSLVEGRPVDLEKLCEEQEEEDE